MSAALAWLINRFRPREGWAPLLLLLVAVLSVPAALLGGSDTMHPVGLIFLTALAVVVGLRLAR